MLTHAMKGDFIKAREELRQLLVKYGLSGSEIVRQIHSEIFRLPVPEKQRISLIEAVGEIDYRLVQGGDEEIQLSALLAKLASDAWFWDVCHVSSTLHDKIQTEDEQGYGGGQGGYRDTTRLDRRMEQE